MIQLLASQASLNLPLLLVGDEASVRTMMLYNFCGMIVYTFVSHIESSGS